MKSTVVTQALPTLLFFVLSVCAWPQNSLTTAVNSSVTGFTASAPTLSSGTSNYGPASGSISSFAYSESTPPTITPSTSGTSSAPNTTSTITSSSTATFTPTSTSTSAALVTSSAAAAPMAMANGIAAGIFAGIVTAIVL